MTVGTNQRSCLEVRLPCEPASVPRARHLVRDLLARKRLGDHPGVLLSVSEACANAIVHAYPGAGDGRDVDLEAWIDGSVLHITVRDYGIGVEAHGQGDVHGHGQGYGLMLIEAHAVDLDVRECEPGTEVAMSFDLSAG